MDQCFAHISVPKRNTANSQCPHQENIVKKRFLSSETTYLIEIKLVHIHEDHSGRHEKSQFDQGMIYHVKQASSHSKQIFLTEKSGHPHSHKNKANLRDRGTCKRTLDIN